MPDGGLLPLDPGAPEVEPSASRTGEDPLEPDPTWLLDANLAHWSIVAGVGGPSALGYGQTVDNGDGTFTNTTVKPLSYAPLELYTMGLLPPDAPELSDLFYVESPAQFVPGTDAAGTPWTHASINGREPVTFAGSRVDLSIDAIVAALGPRTPAYPESQTSFRFGFAILCRPDAPCAPESVAWVDGERVAWEQRFADATGQRAAAITALH